MNIGEILEDFRRRYEGTYVFVRQPKTCEENLMYVEQIEPDNNKVGVITLTSNEIGKVRLNFGSAHTLLFKSAPVGVFQHGNQAYYCRRDPRRQWRRGVCADNTFIYPVGHAVTGERVNFDFELVQDAYNQTVLDGKAGLGLLQERKVRSVALKNDFALCQPMSTAADAFVLFFYQTPVAFIGKNGEITKLFESMFEKEVGQLFNS